MTQPESQAAQARFETRLGLLAIALPATLFGAIASLLGEGRRLQRWDDAFSQAVGAHEPPAVRAAFGVLTHFGEPLVLWALGIVVMAALALRRHYGLALVWVAALLGNAVLTRLLKIAFARARPLIDGLPGPASGYSFPSGHSSASITAYTMLAYLGWRLLSPRWHLPLVLAAIVVALTVACSRVFLQVHYASDVTAGLCAGLAWTALCITVFERWRERRGARP